MLIESGATAAIGQGAKLVAKLIGDKKDARRLRQLAARYWACILFEIAQNLDDISGGLENEAGALPLRFSIFNAVIEELSRIDPAPRALARVGRLISQLKLVDKLYMIRVEFWATPKSLSVSGSSLGWQDVARRHRDDWIHEYKLLRETHIIAAREAYDDDDVWQAQEPELTPPELRPTQKP